MASWGIETWDANGISNNKGLRPFLFSQLIRLTPGQTGSWSITLSPGTKLGFMFFPDDTGASSQSEFTRRINVSGPSVTVSNDSGDPYTAYRSGYGYLFLFLVNQ